MPPKDFVPPRIWARLEDGSVVELGNDRTISELVETAEMRDFQRAVRCKDCKYCYAVGFVHEKNYCELHHELADIPDDWYCADGEREENA